MEKVRRKKIQVREKVGKSRFTVFFQWLGAPEGWKEVTLLKRQVQSQLARWKMNKCTPLWREAHFQVKMYKARQLRTTFGSWDVEKVHAVVARSTFPSQNVQYTPTSDHFWKFSCRKSARRCGAKQMYKTHQPRTTFGSWAVEKVHAVVARSTFPSRKTAWFGHFSKKCAPLWHEAHFQVEKLRGSDTFRKSARRCGTKHISKSKV